MITSPTGSFSSFVLYIYYHWFTAEILLCVWMSITPLSHDFSCHSISGDSAKPLFFSSVIFKTLHLNVFSGFHQHIDFASSSLVKTLININFETEPWRTLFITSLHPGVTSSTFVLSSASPFLSQCRSLLMVSSAAQYLRSYRTIDAFSLSEKSILSRKDIRHTLLINLWV